MHYLYFFSFLFILGIYSCEEPAPQEIPSPIIKEEGPNFTLPPNEQINAAPIFLKVQGKQGPIRSFPFFEAPLLLQVPKDSQVLYTRRYTKDYSTLEINNKNYQAPWLEIQIDKKQTGWIHAAFLELKGDSSCLEILRWQQLQRLQDYFPLQLTEELINFKEFTQSISTLPAFKQYLDQSSSLQKRLEDHLNMSYAQDTVPDFLWSNAYFYGQVLHRNKINNKLHYFRDFKVLAQIAAKTPSTDDDAFIEVCLQRYALDSVEYFYDETIMLIEDSLEFSTLGEGHYKRILDSFQNAWTAQSYFKEELSKVKADLLFTLAQSKKFWVSQEEASEEINLILQQKYTFFSPNDLIEIQVKRDQIQQPLQTFQFNFQEQDFF